MEKADGALDEAKGGSMNLASKGADALILTAALVALQTNQVSALPMPSIAAASPALVMPVAKKEATPKPFVKLEDIKGESQDDKHKDEIQMRKSGGGLPKNTASSGGRMKGH